MGERQRGRQQGGSWARGWWWPPHVDKGLPEDLEKKHRGTCGEAGEGDSLVLLLQTQSPNSVTAEEMWQDDGDRGSGMAGGGACLCRASGMAGVSAGVMLRDD